MKNSTLYSQRLNRILTALELKKPDRTPVVLEYSGLIALLHLDSNWTRELGPQGFILQSGCDIPANAKLENVQAMVAAATGS